MDDTPKAEPQPHSGLSVSSSELLAAVHEYEIASGLSAVNFRSLPKDAGLLAKLDAARRDLRWWEQYSHEVQRPLSRVRSLHRLVRGIAMKIKEVKQITAHIVETDEKDYPTHTRYGPDSWTVSMGESDEQVYECAELEAAFQAFIASNDKLRHGGEKE